MTSRLHQYVDRRTGRAVNEKIFHDRLIRWLYADVRQRAPALFRACTSARSTAALAAVGFRPPFRKSGGSLARFLADTGINLAEAVHPETLNTPRRIFARKIRYEEVRPLPADPRAVVSPADARILPGSFDETDALFIKNRFFDYETLLGGPSRRRWLDAFRSGDFAVFRLTPDQYHYNHVPVDGIVVDRYEVPGAYHSCNPSALLEIATPYSLNRRTVTVIDTDVDGGTGIGLVAMIEIVAMMIGRIRQCYSETGYENPREVFPGMFLRRGCPKSLYEPGSSTDVLIFQRGKIAFDADLLANRARRDVTSRYSFGLEGSVVETDVRVREQIALPADRENPASWTHLRGTMGPIYSGLHNPGAAGGASPPGEPERLK